MEAVAKSGPAVTVRHKTQVYACRRAHPGHYSHPPERTREQSKTAVQYAGTALSTNRCPHGKRPIQNKMSLINKAKANGGRSG